MGSADGSADRGDRVHHGVSLKAWAFVVAGVGDGLAEEELLEHLGLGVERWQLAAATFNEDVLDDLEAGGSLTEEFDEAMHAARGVWSREIPPLDTNLQAWLDYYRAWAVDESPMAFLEAHGLRATDIHRLQDHWREKLAADEALRKDALAILQAPTGPVPTPRPKPPRLPPKRASADSADVTGEVKARRAAAPLPFAEGAPAPSHPKLSVSLPTPRKLGRAGANETRVVVAAGAARLVLPFLAPEPRAQEAVPSVPLPDVLAEDEERVALSLERYAALCADLIDAPSSHQMVLTRYGITPADKLALDVYWTKRLVEDVALWLAWDRACAEHRAGR
jgi:hypothetical protein